MLRIAVRLDPGLLARGEILAEASALEAAGVDTLWLPEADGDLDGAVLLAGLAGAVHRVRLGLALEGADDSWYRRARTLQLLCRGRLCVSLPAERLPAASPIPFLTAGVMAAGVTASVAGDSIGIIHPAASESGALASAVAEAPGSEHWLEGDGSNGRDAWRALRIAAAEAGATGIFVAHNPALLDLLRNPEDEDDRADLLMATG